MSISTAVAIKERPILFSGEMVRAILEDRKTHTRRIAWEFDMHRRMRKLDSSVPVQWASEVHPARDSGFVAWYPGASKGLAEFTKKQYATGFQCKYGKPGDRLWVREAWRPVGPWECRDDNATVQYCADGEYLRRTGWPSEFRIKKSDNRDKWRSPIHMPHWVSRITLEITGIHVELLQEISDKDALAEGVDRTNTSIPGYAKERFKRLWEEINGKKAAWESNPWVWVITFKKLEK